MLNIEINYEAEADGWNRNRTYSWCYSTRSFVLSVPCVFPLLFFCAAHAPSLPLPIWPHILPVSDCLFSINGNRQTQKQGEGAAAEGRKRGEGDDGQNQVLKERISSIRAVQRSLGKRLRRKRQGNWETRSRVRINREEEEEGQDERGKKDGA